jgi:hypothetical protein
VGCRLESESGAEIDLQEVVLGSVDDIPGGFREHPDMGSKAILESSTITAKANAVFMIVLLIDTKDNYPQLIRVALGSIFQMLSLLLSLVRSYGTKVLHLFTGLDL